MHDSSFVNLEYFFNEYFDHQEEKKLIVFDIGSQTSDNEKLKKWKDIFPKNTEYLGIDLVNANNVDLVLNDPYVYPFEDNYADVIIANSIFEHSEFFWVLYLELLRVLKPDGILYINAPSNGDFHRGSHVDVYRFYPDAGMALEKWGKLNNFPKLLLLESYTSKQINKRWNDFVAIFLKNEKYVDKYPNRIIDKFNLFSNGITNRNDGFINYEVLTEDHQKLLNKNYISRLNIFLRKNIRRVLMFLGFKKLFDKQS